MEFDNGSKKKKKKTRKVIESRTLDLFSQVSELPNNQRLRIVIDNYNPTTGRLNVRRLRNILKTEVPVDIESGGVDTALILPPPQQNTNGSEEVKNTEQKSAKSIDCYKDYKKIIVQLLDLKHS